MNDTMLNAVRSPENMVAYLVLEVNSKTGDLMVFEVVSINCK